VKPYCRETDNIKKSLELIEKGLPDKINITVLQSVAFIDVLKGRVGNLLKAL
jgi:hypothetical protein